VFLAVLCLVGLISFIDRQIITILIEPIKREFGASDTAMGALAGIIFSGFYALAAIPLARLSDRLSRRNVIAACVGFWSIMTSLGGFAVSYWMLAATRIGVAVGEAGAGPASHSVIADLFPLNRRATALGLLSAGQAIGIGTGVLLGGILTAAFDWRTSFLVVGFPGLIVAAILLLFFREPRRGMSDSLGQVREQPPFLETMRSCGGSPHTGSCSSPWVLQASPAMECWLGAPASWLASTTCRRAASASGSAGRWRFRW
jgi:MFS family permease